MVEERHQPLRQVLCETVVQHAVLGAVHLVDERGGLGSRAQFGQDGAHGQQLVDGRRCGRDARGRALEDRLGHLFDHGQDGGVLGVEVEVERALRDAGGLDDVADGRVGHAALCEHGRGRRDELGTAGCAVDDAGHRNSRAGGPGVGA